MRLFVHLGRIIADAARYAVSTRRISLLLIVVLGLLLLAVATTTQVVAPLALYPFA